MVNKLQSLTPRPVKAERRGVSDPVATAKGGVVVVQALANRLRLWSDLRRLLPRRQDPTQGFSVVSVVCALVYGLLSGGEGFSATEPLRGDTPLLRLVGLRLAPSAETVEEVMKYVARVSGLSALNRALRRLSVRVLARMGRRRLLARGQGFVPVWLDGSLLEVVGKCFDAIKVIRGKRGQLCVGAFVGPVLAGIDFAGEGVGEDTLVRSFLRRVFRAVVCPLGLASDALILLDSLHGKGPTLDLLESLPGHPSYLVGAQGLETAERVMEELPAWAWRETGPDARRGLSHSAWARAWVQCEGWSRRRPMICHRYTFEGEFVPRYAGIITLLNQNDTRVRKVMETWRLPVEETLWGLYDLKQGMENQWKEPLSDLGLHHPPCAQAAVNAVFYAVGALAYNLAVGVRELGLSGKEDRGMRLWRFRREMIDLVATVTSHAGRVVARLLDGRDHLVDRLLAAMHRLARC